MANDRERQALEVVLQEAANGEGEFARLFADLLEPGKSPMTSTNVAVEVTSVAPNGDHRDVGVLLRIVDRGTLIEQELKGQCRLETPRVESGSLVLWRTPVPKPMDLGERLSVRQWALLVSIALTLLTVAGCVAWYLALREAAESDTTIVELLLLTGAVGWSGACGAALRTVMDRYRNGFEYDEHDGDGVVRRQWPPASPGTERFSTLIAPTCLGRPLLGLVVGPVAYFLTQSGATAVLGRGPSSEPDALVLTTAMAVSGLAGMFAKSIWDNLNERAQNLFK